MRYLAGLVFLVMLAVPGTTAAAPPTVPAVLERLAAVPDGFSGIVGVWRQGQPVHLSAHGRMTSPDRSVRWASVTKSVTAVLVLQEVDAGRLSLDTPLSTYLPDWPVNGDATLRQLLMHTSGLADLSDSPDADADGMADVYQGQGPGWRALCERPARAPAGSGFTYNNCDYRVLGLILESVTGEDFETLVRTRIGEPLGLSSLRLAANEAVSEAFDGTRPEPQIDVSAYGPAGAMYGTVEALLAFDQALLDGRLISDDALAEMWKAGPESGYGGLSVWVFPVTLTACGVETRVVERQGAIGGVQVRNLILPDLDVAVVLWTDQATLDFGQTWSGEGLTIDLLAAVVCGEGD
ncbi:MAG: beta-lactamase family protein [Alphaproteobacteria bacterium]|nr:beta-lactamase family protein [Alphaproteobacteria bacterium]